MLAGGKGLDRDGPGGLLGSGWAGTGAAWAGGTSGHCGDCSICGMGGADSGGVDSEFWVLAEFWVSWAVAAAALANFCGQSGWVHMQAAQCHHMGLQVLHSHAASPLRMCPPQLSHVPTL